MGKNRILFFFLLVIPVSAIADTNNLVNNLPHKCVQIYYDRASSTADPNYYNGRLYAIALQNLISHFPAIQQYIIPVDLYQKGQLERCATNFYLGTYYDNNIPQDFRADFVNTKKMAVWIGYNFWQLTQENLKKIWSFEFGKLFSPDWSTKDSQGRPGIYNYFEYKGETFERCKYPFSADSPEFKAHYSQDYDIALLNLTTPIAKKNVIAWARFTMNDHRVPYIVRQSNHWYVADNPFLFICEGDRYFIFADVLFDMLDEPSQEGGKKYALIRYEDVSPRQSLVKITTLVDMFNKMKINFVISLIPIYVDPLHVYSDIPYQEIKDKLYFIQALKYAEKQGATFVFHGVTHQYRNQKNPFSGVSGEDFEFWDKSIDSPIAEDSPSYVLDRLTRGAGLAKNAGFNFVAWMTAHYLASPLDNVIFGQVFSWNVTRGNYSVSKICGMPTATTHLTYDQGNSDPNTNQLRQQAFAKLKVQQLSTNQINQILPYPIYGDYYGRRVIPEDLGNIQPYFSTQVIAKRTVDEIIRDAKRYSVLRDVWGSLFIHDILLNTKENNGIAEHQNGTKELERLIQAMKDDGYEFVDLKEWTRKHLWVKQPEPIEVAAPGNCLS